MSRHSIKEWCLSAQHLLREVALEPGSGEIQRAIEVLSLEPDLSKMTLPEKDKSASAVKDVMGGALRAIIDGLHSMVSQDDRRKIEVFLGEMLVQFKNYSREFYADILQNDQWPLLLSRGEIYSLMIHACRQQQFVCLKKLDELSGGASLDACMSHILNDKLNEMAPQVANEYMHKVTEACSRIMTISENNKRKWQLESFQVNVLNYIRDHLKCDDYIKLLYSDYFATFLLYKYRPFRLNVSDSEMHASYILYFVSMANQVENKAAMQCANKAIDEVIASYADCDLAVLGLITRYITSMIYLNAKDARQSTSTILKMLVSRYSGSKWELKKMLVADPVGASNYTFRPEILKSCLEHSVPINFFLSNSMLMSHLKYSKEALGECLYIIRHYFFQREKNFFYDPFYVDMSIPVKLMTKEIKESYRKKLQESALKRENSLANIKKHAEYLKAMARRVRNYKSDKKLIALFANAVSCDLSLVNNDPLCGTYKVPMFMMLSAIYKKIESALMEVIDDSDMLKVKSVLIKSRVEAHQLIDGIFFIAHMDSSDLWLPYVIRHLSDHSDLILLGSNYFRSKMRSEINGWLEGGAINPSFCALKQLVNFLGKQKKGIIDIARVAEGERKKVAARNYYIAEALTSWFKQSWFKECIRCHCPEIQHVFSSELSAEVGQPKPLLGRQVLSVSNDSRSHQGRSNLSIFLGAIYDGCELQFLETSDGYDESSIKSFIEKQKAEVCQFITSVFDLLYAGTSKQNNLDFIRGLKLNIYSDLLFLGTNQFQKKFEEYLTHLPGAEVMDSAIVSLVNFLKQQRAFLGASIDATGSNHVRDHIARDILNTWFLSLKINKEIAGAQKELRFTQYLAHTAPELLANFMSTLDTKIANIEFQTCNPFAIADDMPAPIFEVLSLAYGAGATKKDGRQKKKRSSRKKGGHKKRSRAGASTSQVSKVCVQLLLGYLRGKNNLVWVIWVLLKEDASSDRYRSVTRFLSQQIKVLSQSDSWRKGSLTTFLVATKPCLLERHRQYLSPYILKDLFSHFRMDLRSELFRNNLSDVLYQKYPRELYALMRLYLSSFSKFMATWKDTFSMGINFIEMCGYFFVRMQFGGGVPSSERDHHSLMQTYSRCSLGYLGDCSSELKSSTALNILALSLILYPDGHIADKFRYLFEVMVSLNCSPSNFAVYVSDYLHRALDHSDVDESLPQGPYLRVLQVLPPCAVYSYAWRLKKLVASKYTQYSKQIRNRRALENNIKTLKTLASSIGIDLTKDPSMFQKAAEQFHDDMMRLSEKDIFVMYVSKVIAQSAAPQYVIDCREGIAKAIALTSLPLVLRDCKSKGTVTVSSSQSANKRWINVHVECSDGKSCSMSLPAHANDSFYIDNTSTHCSLKCDPSASAGQVPQPRSANLSKLADVVHLSNSFVEVEKRQASFFKQLVEQVLGYWRSHDAHVAVDCLDSVNRPEHKAGLIHIISDLDQSIDQLMSSHDTLEDPPPTDRGDLFWVFVKDVLVAMCDEMSAVEKSAREEELAHRFHLGEATAASNRQLKKQASAAAHRQARSEREAARDLLRRGIWFEGDSAQSQQVYQDYQKALVGQAGLSQEQISKFVVSLASCFADAVRKPHHYVKCSTGKAGSNRKNRGLMCVGIATATKYFQIVCIGYHNGLGADGNASKYHLQFMHPRYQGLLPSRDIDISQYGGIHQFFTSLDKRLTSDDVHASASTMAAT